jgi:hypothetical protein
MAAHRKSDRRRACLCAGGLRKRAQDIFAMLQREGAHGIALVLSTDETLPSVKVTLVPRCPLGVPA